MNYYNMYDVNEFRGGGTTLKFYSNSVAGFNTRY